MKSVGDLLLEERNKRETVFRQGKVVSIQTGPPRSCTVLIDGTNYPAVRMADHVDPVVNEGVWIADMGQGRWLIIATNSNAQKRAYWPNGLQLGDGAVGTPSIAFDDNTGIYSAADEEISFSTNGNKRVAIRDGYPHIEVTPDSGQFPKHLKLNPSGHASSENVSLTIDNWELGQDSSGNGTKNFYLYQNSPGRLIISIDASSGEINSLGPGAGLKFQDRDLTSDYGAIYKSGNIVRIWDGNIGDIMQFNSSGECQPQVGTKSPYVIGSRNGAASWGNAQLIAGDYGGASTTAHLAMRAGSYSVQWRMNDTGTNTWMRNSDDTAYIILNVDVVDQSSMRYKRDIKPYLRALSAAVPGAIDRLMQIEVVTYRRKRQPKIAAAKDGRWDERRAAALEVLNERRAAQGMDPYQQFHECGVDCDHTPEDPCHFRINEEQELPGVIAEQLQEVLPEVVQYDGDKPEGVKTLSLLAVAIKAIQELTERVRTLEAQVDALT